MLNKIQPTNAEAKHTKEGEKEKVTARHSTAKAGWLMYRKAKGFAFSRTAMWDDGTNGDVTAKDGIYTTVIDASLCKHYYIAAEGEEGAATFPERASFAFLSVE